MILAEPLVPNETTIAAMCEARCGNLKSFDSVESWCGFMVPNM